MAKFLKKKVHQKLPEPPAPKPVDEEPKKATHGFGAGSFNN